MRPGRAVIYGTVIGLAAVAVNEAVRPRGGTALLVDWQRVRHHASAALGRESIELAGATERYRTLASGLQRPLLDFVGGLPRGASLPAFEALDRAGWLEVNLEIIRRAIDPLIEAGRVPNSLAVQVGGAGVDRYLGHLLAFLSRRVMGQYDPQLLGAEPIGAARLYLLETNVEEWGRRADLPQDDLRRWLILHEMTHAWQFAAHPWLRPYLEHILREVLDSVTARTRRLGRLAGLAAVLPAQWRVLRQVQAVMSVIEGYSNLVMSELGAQLLPGYARLERAYLERSSGRSFVETMIWKLTGLDLKLQQYRRGEDFCRAVFDRHGMEVLNRVWDGPESLPSLEELGRPAAWHRLSPGALPAPSPR